MENITLTSDISEVLKLENFAKWPLQQKKTPGHSLTYNSHQYKAKNRNKWFTDKVKGTDSELNRFFSIILPFSFCFFHFLIANIAL